MNIQRYDSSHREAVVDLSLRAWAPVFASLEAVMDAEVYLTFYPDWRVAQRQAVEEACANEGNDVWVAVEAGQVVGFVISKFHDDNLGEIHMIAVDPAYQRRGIGSALTTFALEQLKRAGASIAMVETGGDPGHAPARSAYEKLGFRQLPIARYFKKL